MIAINRARLAGVLVVGLAASGCPDSEATPDTDETGTSAAESSTTNDVTTLPGASSGEQTDTTAADDSTTTDDGSTTDDSSTTGDDSASDDGSTDVGESTGTTGGCADAEVSCDGRCIDPLSDDEFCGASNDCEGDNAGQLCGPSAPCTEGECAETCDNCGFETGDFTGWIAADLARPYFPLNVTSGGETFLSHEVTPTEGSYCAMNGFDGSGPGTIELGQDITLDADTPADLRFDYRAAWSVSGTQDRTFDVAFEPAGGGDPLEVVNILTAENDTEEEDTGDLPGLVDLSSYAGQTVFVRFIWNIPEYFTGPAQAQLDNVRIVPQGPGYNVSWCVLQHPPSVTVAVDEDFTVYVRLYAEGLTDLTGNNDPDPLLVVQLGYGPDGSAPSLDGAWSYITADPNPGYGPGAPDYGANNDEYWGELSIPTAGTHDFAGRVSGDGGATWVYCDLDGLTEGGYTPAQAGDAEVGP